MPTYVYRCKQCAQDIEKNQTATDKPLRTCETCGGFLERLVPEGVQFHKQTETAAPESTPSKECDHHHDGTTCALHQNPELLIQRLTQPTSEES